MGRQTNDYAMVRVSVLKLRPTITPITGPMMAPAAKSENQWMVMDTPKPTYSAYTIAAVLSHRHFGRSVTIVKAMAKAMVV